MKDFNEIVMIMKLSNKTKSINQNREIKINKVKFKNENYDAINNQNKKYSEAVFRNNILLGILQ